MIREAGFSIEGMDCMGSLQDIRKNLGKVQLLKSDFEYAHKPERTTEVDSLFFFLMLLCHVRKRSSSSLLPHHRPYISCEWGSSLFLSLSIWLPLLILSCCTESAVDNSGSTISLPGLCHPSKHRELPTKTQ